MRCALLSITRIHANYEELCVSLWLNYNRRTMKLGNRKKLTCALGSQVLHRWANTRIRLALAFMLFSTCMAYSQGFYLKPSFSYGAALSKQQIKYYGNEDYVQTAYIYESSVNTVPTGSDSKDVTYEKVPLGQGKQFELALGYESKKLFFYTLGFSLGLMDKFMYRSFRQYDDRYDIQGTPIISRGEIETDQIVSPVWYGVEPGIGIYKNLGTYKLYLEVSAFFGKARIRVMEEIRHEANDWSSRYGWEHYNTGASQNNVLKGTMLYGGGLQLGLERKMGDKSTIGLTAEYKSLIYKVTQNEQKELRNYIYLLGSAIPVSFDEDPVIKEVPVETQRSYLFESLSFSITWKRYLFQGEKD